MSRIRGKKKYEVYIYFEDSYAPFLSAGKTIYKNKRKAWNKAKRLRDKYPNCFTGVRTPPRNETPTSKVSINTHENKVTFKECNTLVGVFFKGVTEVCTYPECNCPFDMGADNKCLRGFCNAK